MARERYKGGWGCWVSLAISFAVIDVCLQGNPKSSAWQVRLKVHRCAVMPVRGLTWKVLCEPRILSFCWPITRDLACCSPCGRQEFDMTEQLNWTEHQGPLCPSWSLRTPSKGSWGATSPLSPLHTSSPPPFLEQAPKGTSYEFTVVFVKTFLQLVFS